MNNILIRADSSSYIGAGHIMRDLVLADQYKDSNIIFASQDLAGNINHIIEEQNYQLEVLKSNTVDEVISLISKYSIDMVIIDNYDIDNAYEKELKEKTGATIFVLDDTYERHFCDILLNHNLYADVTKYNGLIPNQCELRCGSKYTLLRDEFIQEKIRPKNRSSKSSQKNIFVAMGGADHSNITIEILKVLEKFPTFFVNVVTTTANAHLSELKAYVNTNDHIALHVNSNQIARLMHEADFAIITPSVTANEAFYMELPFVAIKTAINQHYMYEYLTHHNYAVLNDFNPTELQKKITLFLSTLNTSLHNFVNLTLEKKQMILEWRNHPSIRKWMFNQNEILMNDHLSHIDSLQLKTDKLYFLVTKDNEDIGVIDFTNIDKKNKSVEFGIYAKPGLKGSGTLLMNLIIEYAFNNLKMTTLISEVFAENKIAIELYLKYNFHIKEKKKRLNQSIIRMELHK